MGWICQAGEVCIYHRGLLIFLGCSCLMMVSLKDENALGLGWDINQEKNSFKAFSKKWKHKVCNFLIWCMYQLTEASQFTLNFLCMCEFLTERDDGILPQFALQEEPLQHRTVSESVTREEDPQYLYMYEHMQMYANVSAYVSINVYEKR